MVKRWLPGAHFEESIGTVAAASKYYKKYGDFTEFGSLPSDTRKDYPFRDVLEKAELGDFMSIKADYPKINLRYKVCLHSCKLFDHTLLPISCGMVVCGLYLIGKDYAVRHFPPFYVKSLKNWWVDSSNKTTFS